MEILMQTPPMTSLRFFEYLDRLRGIPGIDVVIALDHDARLLHEVLPVFEQMARSLEKAADLLDHGNCVNETAMNSHAVLRSYRTLTSHPHWAGTMAILHAERELKAGRIPGIQV